MHGHQYNQHKSDGSTTGELHFSEENAGMFRMTLFTLLTLFMSIQTAVFALLDMFIVIDDYSEGSCIATSNGNTPKRR